MEKSQEKKERKEFRVPSDLSEVQRASERVLEFLKPLALSEAYQFDIRLCLEEALINAMKYGNGLKRELDVRLDVEYDAGAVRLSVEDQGSGFDVSAIKDCTDKENLLRNRGRGVYLIHKLMDEVRYNTQGNRVQMVKFLQDQTNR
jgi:serine/threonine-protein kinase RsbW